MRNDYNKNLSRTSNSTCNSNSSIGSTSNRSNSNRSNSKSSNSSITGVLVVLWSCSSERDATPTFFRETKCLRIFLNLTLAVARVTDEGRARLARQRFPVFFIKNKRNAVSCSV